MVMHKWIKDLSIDLSMFFVEVIVVAVKVLFIYLVLVNIGRLSYEMALSTAVLVGAADFLGSNRVRFRTVQDLHERVTTITTKGKTRVTKSIHNRTTKDPT